jgi:NAD(P)-dependent dehydrogenase (short-subunit alcohol dehydrogenase family)
MCPLLPALPRRSILDSTRVRDPGPCSGIGDADDAPGELFMGGSVLRRAGLASPAWLDGELGRIDFLANIAGEGILADPRELTVEQLRQVLENLVVGRFALCQQSGRRMLAAGSGSIVNTGSLASMTALGRGHIAYSMAMGAVVQMTRELSTEWAGGGVRVNAILPAQVRNPSLEKRIAADPTIEQKWLSGIPAGRLGRPDDIQGLIVFLASDSSSWITGALIPMDGGNMAMNAGGSRGFSSPPS